MKDQELFEYMHILPRRKGDYVVKGYDTYPEHSVLAGQTRIHFVDSFDTIQEAEEAYPEATLSHELLEPVNTFDHLDDREGSY